MLLSATYTIKRLSETDDIGSSIILTKDNQKLFETVLASIEKMKHVRLFFSLLIIKKQAIRQQTELHTFETI